METIYEPVPLHLLKSEIWAASQLKAAGEKSPNTRQARAKTNTKNKRTPHSPASPPYGCVLSCGCTCVCLCGWVCITTLAWLSMADAVGRWRLPPTAGCQIPLMMTRKAEYRTNGGRRMKQKWERGRKRSSFVFQTRVAMRAQHGMLTKLQDPAPPPRTRNSLADDESGCGCVCVCRSDIYRGRCSANVFGFCIQN